jgi:hypothetical protein
MRHTVKATIATAKHKTPGPRSFEKAAFERPAPSEAITAEEPNNHLL